MSSETDQPRQRTVAELLAAHGEGGGSGRRRRRREADDEAVGGHAPERFDPGYGDRIDDLRAIPRDEPRLPSLPDRPVLPDRSVLREPVPRDGGSLPRYRNESYRLTPLEPADEHRPPPVADLPPRPVAPPEHRRERPTEQMPRLRTRHAAPDLDVTGPIPVPPGLSAHAAPAPEAPPVPADRPSRRARHMPPAEPHAVGPATVVGAPPAGAEAWHRERVAEPRPVDPGPATQASPPIFDDAPAGLEDDDLADGLAEDLAEGRDEPAADSRAGVGQMWAAVVAQWIAGAIGGAALWVGFRYLWRSVPVVATAAAVVVTVGLVVIVRALLHNDDRRTTVFAVLVGLLLTVSPAILVLMGR